MHKYKIGDKVIYDGLIATVESQSTYAISNEPCYGIVSDEDSELTCTVGEDECELYKGEEIDQSERLRKARFESAAIDYLVNSITDKYYRDGCH